MKVLKNGKLEEAEPEREELLVLLGKEYGQRGIWRFRKWLKKSPEEMEKMFSVLLGNRDYLWGLQDNPEKALEWAGRIIYHQKKEEEWSKKARENNPGRNVIYISPYGSTENVWGLEEYLPLNLRLRGW